MAALSTGDSIETKLMRSGNQEDDDEAATLLYASAVRVCNENILYHTYFCDDIQYIFD